jgi:hypothetical protein
VTISGPEDIAFGGDAGVQFLRPLRSVAHAANGPRRRSLSGRVHMDSASMDVACQRRDLRPPEGATVI